MFLGVILKKNNNKSNDNFQILDLRSFFNSKINNQYLINNWVFIINNLKNEIESINNDSQKQKYINEEINNALKNILNLINLLFEKIEFIKRKEENNRESLLLICKMIEENL